MNQEKQVSMLPAVAVVIGLVICVIALWMTIIPRYNVWQQGMEGEAALSKANQTRQILITQAQAEKDSATLRAEAIRIMGQAAKDFPEYREQEFIGAFGDALKEGKINQIIYVPTEANIPILERNRKGEK